MASLSGSDSVGSGFVPGLQDPAITYGVWGDSGAVNGDGVVGSSAFGAGVFGRSFDTDTTGVKGSSQNGTGVEAISSAGTALHAHFVPEGGAVVTEAFLATSRLAADFRGDVATTGNIAVGVPAQQAKRPLHVEGSQIHSGGAQGGYSFADRTSGSGAFVEDPTAGQRWVWYAQGGAARLWSGTDRLTVSAVGEGGGLDVARRMRVRQANDSSAGIWFFQSAPQSDRGFVGMADDTHIGFWGNTGAGWGLTMDTTNGVVNIPRGASMNAQLSVINNQPANASTAVCASSNNGVGVFAAGKTALNAVGPSTFTGDVTISGALSAREKHCLIDHPSDPENKTLTHACVEADERLNVYSGNVELDESGEARVTLPEWVAAFNKDFRYQLTCIGQAAPVYVAREVGDDGFSIAGGAAGMKVSWQLTGVRNDAYAQANPLLIEQEKPEDEKGFFLNPEAFGHDHSRHVQYKRHEHLVQAFPRQAERTIAAYTAHISPLGPG